MVRKRLINIPEIIPAVPEHIPFIAEHVREDDRRELEALDLWPSLALKVSLRSSLEAWTGMIDGIPICMFGVCPGELGEGRPWMIGTDKFDDPLIAMIFLRRCKAQVRRMLELTPVLANYVSADNVRAVHWLRWLGFSFSLPVQWGRRRQLFYRFELRRQS